MEFSDWITRKFIKWRDDKVGNKGSITRYAKLFGASQSLMSQWMMKDGKKPTEAKYIAALVEQYGDEVYEVLGIGQSDKKNFDDYDPADAAALSAAFNDLQGIDPSTPDGFNRAIKIFSEHGLKVIKTFSPDGS